MIWRSSITALFLDWWLIFMHEFDAEPSCKPKQLFISYEPKCLLSLWKHTPLNWTDDDNNKIDFLFFPIRLLRNDWSWMKWCEVGRRQSTDMKIHAHYMYVVASGLMRVQTCECARYSSGMRTIWIDCIVSWAHMGCVLLCSVMYADFSLM